MLPLCRFRAETVQEIYHRAKHPQVRACLTRGSRPEVFYKIGFKFVKIHMTQNSLF